VAKASNQVNAVSDHDRDVQRFNEAYIGSPLTQVSLLNNKHFDEYTTASGTKRLRRKQDNFSYADGSFDMLKNDPATKI
jgi:hypothetical protein